MKIGLKMVFSFFMRDFLFLVFRPHTLPLPSVGDAAFLKAACAPPAVGDSVPPALSF
jgi:hypothetical protein